jgi:hypothetical protein
MPVGRTGLIFIPASAGLKCRDLLFDVGGSRPVQGSSLVETRAV